jgi:hypothetical protein
MIYATTARSLLRKGPQQIQRASNVTRSVSTDSFAFYPVQSNRVRIVQQKSTTSNSFAFYPSEGIDRAAIKAAKIESSTAKSSQAVRVASTRKRKATHKVSKEQQEVSNWDTLALQFLKTPQKTVHA